jgi:hypothetical protein
MELELNMTSMRVQPCRDCCMLLRGACLNATHCEGCGKSTRATVNRADLSKVVYQKLGACALSRTYPTASMLQCAAERYSAI